MRTTIPKNQVSFDYTGILKEYVSIIHDKQKDNLVCVYLCGSYARGEATELSDLDVFCIFNELSIPVLQDVGFAARNVSALYESIEINPQCLSIHEFNDSIFNGWTEKTVRIFDGVLLFGKDLLGNAANREILYCWDISLYSKGIEGAFGG